MPNFGSFFQKTRKVPNPTCYGRDFAYPGKQGSADITQVKPVVLHVVDESTSTTGRSPIFETVAGNLSP